MKLYFVNFVGAEISDCYVAATCEQDAAKVARQIVENVVGEQETPVAFFIQPVGA
jgi:hypothetical protein